MLTRPPATMFVDAHRVAPRREDGVVAIQLPIAVEDLQAIDEEIRASALAPMRATLFRCASGQRSCAGAALSRPMPATWARHHSSSFPAAAWRASNRGARSRRP